MPVPSPRLLVGMRRLARALAAAFAGAVIVRLARRMRMRSGERPGAVAESRPVAPGAAEPDRAAPLFSRRANTILLGGVAALVAVGAGSIAFAMGWVRSPYATGQNAVVLQPVPFNHQLHVTGFGIECRYCHSTADRAATAGMPDTRTCVPCHNRTWFDGPWFEPVRHSLATGRAIPWRRVNDLPDFAFFDHASHERRGVPCATCHGDVARMPVVYQTAPLTMRWCLDCHVNPEPWLRPTAGGAARTGQRRSWPVPPETPAALSAVVARLTTCTACHR